MFEAVPIPLAQFICGFCNANADCIEDALDHEQGRPGHFMLSRIVSEGS